MTGRMSTAFFCVYLTDCFPQTLFLAVSSYSVVEGRGQGRKNAETVGVTETEIEILALIPFVTQFLESQPL